MIKNIYSVFLLHCLMMGSIVSAAAANAAERRKAGQTAQEKMALCNPILDKVLELAKKRMIKVSKRSVKS